MVTDEMLKRAIEAYAKDTGAEGFQLEGWIEPAIRAALKAALSAAEPIGVRCTGCGSSWDDERLAEEKAKRPELVSCCPERKVIPVYAAPPALSVGVRADAIVDRLFDDLRDRRFLKWIFDARGSDCYIGDMGGQKITGLDLDVQHEIKSQWSNIIESALSAQVQDVAGKPIGYMRKQDNDGNSFWVHRVQNAYYSEPVYAAAPAKLEGKP